MEAWRRYHLAGWTLHNVNYGGANSLSIPLISCESENLVVNEGVVTYEGVVTHGCFALYDAGRALVRKCSVVSGASSHSLQVGSAYFVLEVTEISDNCAQRTCELLFPPVVC